MNIYEKLMRARISLQEKKLEKTGHNKFAGYKYFELIDFLPTIQIIMSELGLCGIISFNDELATLTITDCDAVDSKIIITSPMAKAALKGCNDIQNIGAVETYQRRYLWVSAFEVVEHDAIDSSPPIETKEEIYKHSPLPKTNLSDKRTIVVHKAASSIIDHFSADDMAGAFEEASGIIDEEEKI